jgi:hypothetical protein
MTRLVDFRCNALRRASPEWCQAFAVAYRFSHVGLPFTNAPQNSRRPTVQAVQSSLQQLQVIPSNDHARGYLRGVLWSVGSLKDTPQNTTEQHYQDLFSHMLGSKPSALSSYLANALSGKIGVDPFVLVGVFQASQHCRQLGIPMALDGAIADPLQVSDYIRMLSYQGMAWNELKEIELKLVGQKLVAPAPRTPPSLVGWRLPSGARGIDTCARVVGGR